MSARCPICSPAPCATICCSRCATPRFGRQNTRVRKPAVVPGSYLRHEDPATSISTSMPTGSTTRLALSRRITEVLARLDSDSDVYSLGLRWRLDPEDEPETAARLLEARKALASRLVEDEIANLVETYDPE